MPTYDYICDACDEKLEIFQKITDDPIKKCPACKKNKLVRQFGTGAAIVFKGSGFYQTDYRSESYKKSADSERKSADSGKESGSKESENKDSGGSTGDSTTKSETKSTDSSASTPKNKPGKSDKSDK